MVNQNHPLIPREQNYLVDQKLVSIHSEDRDVAMWPNSNHFEVTLPQAFENVVSIRLLNTDFPVNLYVFSNEQQNTKLQITFGVTSYTVTISPGTYTPTQLAEELAGQITAETGITVNVIYDPVRDKYWFWTANPNSFSLDFNKEIPYDLSCATKSIFDRPLKWGLGDYIGFKKSKYTATQAASTINFYYMTATSIPATSWYVEAPLSLCINGNTQVYMEIDKYNFMDELDPFVTNTTALYENHYSARVNSAFAKIPINILTTLTTSSYQDGLNGVSNFYPPLKRIQKLKFKFRYHNKHLVDFQDCNFNFTLQISALKNEPNLKANLIRKGHFE